MRPAREFNVVLRARDQQVTSLQDQTDFLKAQLEAFERRLTNARANAHADARAYQLQERKVEQLRVKLRDARAGSAAQRRALEDVRRESEMQRIQLAETQKENFRHLTRIAELEEVLQAKSSPVSTSDVEYLELEGVSRDDILDVLAQVTTDLEAAARMTEELSSFDQLPDRTARANRVEMGIQTVSRADQSGGSSRQLQGAGDMERPVLQAHATSERDQQRIRELEVALENDRRLNEVLRSSAEEDCRLLQNLKASSVQEQSRVASLEIAARQDQQAIKVLEATTDEYRSEIDSLEAQIVLFRTLLEESRTFNDDLEDSYSAIVACKDTFIQDLREKVEELATSQAWNQQREASLQDAQERLAAADIEFLELRLELEGEQRNAVASTNRIIQLEAEASVARHRLRTADIENGDLREEIGVASERVYALEDELGAAQGRLDNAESMIRQLRHDLEGYVTLARLPNNPRIQDDIHDVNDTDSASDEGTLVMDPEEQSQLLLQLPSRVKDVDSPASPSAHDLEVRLEAMTLKYEAAEAARICGEDVEDMLRAKLQALSSDDLCPNTQLSTAPSPIKSDPDVRTDSPSEGWHILHTIPEEDERSPSPTPERVAPPRIQTCFSFAAKKAVPITAGSPLESPLLPSPTLSDIWFSDMRVSLALVETGSSVLDWDLPSPGGDSDS
jgi:DNA repair exonuclease SbcCD ATPase subunit